MKVTDKKEVRWKTQQKSYRHWPGGSKRLSPKKQEDLWPKLRPSLTGCCPATIRQHLQKGFKKSLQRPRLHRCHNIARLDFTWRHQTRDIQKWKKVLFSDEHKFNFDSPDGFQCYWLHSGRGAIMVFNGASGCERDAHGASLWPRTLVYMAMTGFSNRTILQFRLFPNNNLTLLEHPAC